MKKYTQADVDAFPVANGIKQCPTGDYTAISRFAERCRFAGGCRFAEWCSFAEGCSFAEWCRFAGGCRFAEGCSFAEWCRFAERCRLENRRNPMLTRQIWSAGGLGSEGRTTYAIPMKNGVYVRCGCWHGYLDEFREVVAETHGDSGHAEDYLAIADLWQAKHARLLAEQGDG